MFAQRIAERPFLLADRELVQYTRNGLAVARGPANEFPMNVLETIARKTKYAYLQNGLFPGFPRTDSAVHELDVALRSNLEDRLVVSVAQAEEIIGGCMVALGKSEDSIDEVSGTPETALPTLWALDVPLDQHQARDVPERRTACYTRYWRDPEVIDPCVQKLAAMETLVGMALVVTEFTSDGSIELGLLDTHNAKVAKGLYRYYGARFLAKPGQSHVTPQARESILRCHYEPLESVIAVLWFDFARQVEIARQIDQQLDVFSYGC